MQYSRNGYVNDASGREPAGELLRIFLVIHAREVVDSFPCPSEPESIVLILLPILPILLILNLLVRIRLPLNSSPLNGDDDDDDNEDDDDDKENDADGDDYNADGGGDADKGRGGADHDGGDRR